MATIITASKDNSPSAMVTLRNLVEVKISEFEDGTMVKPIRLVEGILDEHKFNLKDLVDTLPVNIKNAAHSLLLAPTLVVCDVNGNPPIGLTAPGTDVSLGQLDESILELNISLEQLTEVLLYELIDFTVMLKSMENNYQLDKEFHEKSLAHRLTEKHPVGTGYTTPMDAEALHRQMNSRKTPSENSEGEDEWGDRIDNRRGGGYEEYMDRAYNGGSRRSGGDYSRRNMIRDRPAMSDRRGEYSRRDWERDNRDAEYDRIEQEEIQAKYEKEQLTIRKEALVNNQQHITQIMEKLVNDDGRNLFIVANLVTLLEAEVQNVIRNSTQHGHGRIHRRMF